MATNPYVNKVQKADGSVIIDLTADTLDASKVLSGYTGHDATGAPFTGAYIPPSGAISVVDTPDSHGGTVRTITAVDISDTTAVASDVASGKYFYTAGGTKTAGTASGGGGGLEYETGTFTPTEDTEMYEITFSNTHSDRPFFTAILIDYDAFDGTQNTRFMVEYFNWDKLFGNPIYVNDSGSAGTVYYGQAFYRGYSTASLTSGNTTINYPDSDTATSTATHPGYFATNTEMHAFGASSAQFRAGKTYHWIAIWAPTT